MSLDFEFSFQLPSVMRDDDTDWEEVDTLHMDLWDEVASQIRERRYAHEACQATVRANWMSLCRRQRSLHKLRETAYLDNPASFD